MRTPSRLFCLIAAMLGLLLWDPPTARGGSPEELVGVAVHPTDPSRMVLRYQNAGDGLFFSDDAGASWRMLCGSAIDPARFKGGGPVAILGDGTLVMGTRGGVWEGEGTGCSWKHLPLEGEGLWLPDVAAHPTDPDVLFAISSRNAPGERNGIWRRASDGTWARVGSADETVLLRLHVAATEDGLRFYESALLNDSTQSYPPVTRVSDDEGATWREFVGGFEGAPVLQAIDPTNPDRLVAVLDQSAPQTAVLVSSDGGETFAEYMQLVQFGAIAFAPDGRVWIGDGKGGLWHASSLDEKPARIADFPVRCLTYSPNGKLYACQAWSFGTVDLASAAFQVTLDLRTAPGLVSCDDTDIAAACEAQLCDGFCKRNHFGQAPLCCVYEDPSCGPQLLDPEDRQCGGMGFEPPEADAGLESAEAGVADWAEPALASSRAGCRCGSVGTSRAGRSNLATAVGLLALCLGLCRARRSAGA